jgi:hypothetical protein
MVSNPVSELLHAAREELSRIEPPLQQDPNYRKCVALHRLIAEYTSEIAGSRQPDLRSRPETPRAAAGDSLRYPSPPAEGLRSESSHPVSRRGGSRENSQAARIRKSATIFLEKTRKPATGTEIYKGIREMGLEVRGKKPSSTVCNALTSYRRILVMTCGFRRRRFGIAKPPDW